MAMTFEDQSTATPAVHIRRLAFLNEWSDELVAHARGHLQGTPDEELGAMQRAADDLNLSVLRGGDETLAQRAAATLGFASLDDLRLFQRENPLLSAALKAEPALNGGYGRVVGVSSTEVVFATEHGPMFFERAWLKADVGVGDAVRVGKFGDAEVMAGSPASVYEPGTKYNGPIPEIKYLPVTAIHRQEMDFRPEVTTISDEEADKMVFSAPVEVTAFRYGPANHVTPRNLEMSMTFIKCEQANVGLLQSLGSLTGAYDPKRGGVPAELTAETRAKLEEFPADFVVEEDGKLQQDQDSAPAPKLWRVTLDWNPNDSDEGDYCTKVWAASGDQAVVETAEEMADQRFDPDDADYATVRQAYIKAQVQGAGQYSAENVADMIAHSVRDLLAGPDRSPTQEANMDLDALLALLRKYGASTPEPKLALPEEPASSLSPGL